MFGLSNWDVLSIISIISLIVFFGKKNAVWGSFTFGIIVGIITGLIYLIKGSGFNWMLCKRIIIVATLLGVIIELIGRISHKQRSV